MFNCIYLYQYTMINWTKLNMFDDFYIWWDKIIKGHEKNKSKNTHNIYALKFSLSLYEDL